LANSPQARKRARQNLKRREQNVSQRSAMRTQIKKFLKLVEAGDKEAAAQVYRTACSLLDRAARKNLEEKNKASRLKSRLNTRLKAISV
jgi:small subunit ribosomal protein S20